MLYVAALDMADLSGSITVDTAGESQIVVALNSIVAADADGNLSSVFFPWRNYNGCFQHNHVDFSIVDATQCLRHIAVTDLQQAISLALQEAATLAGWASTGLSVTADADTGLWTVGYTQAFTLSWTNANVGLLLGFDETQSGQTIYTSTVQPRYTIVPTVPAPSEVTPAYEPDGIGTLAVADDGISVYGISRTESPYYRDWMQEFETLAKSQAVSAAAAHPWTFQHLYRHCRGTYPFLVVNGFPYALPLVFHFRSEGIANRPSYYNQHAQSWEHTFRCVEMGFTGLVL